MSKLKRFLGSVFLIGILFVHSIPISANTSALYVVESGGSAYTSYYNYSQIYGANHSSGSVTLNTFKFNGWARDQMPFDGNATYRINTRFYNRSPLNQVSNVGHHYYAGQALALTYFDGCGTVGAQYRLKTNSNYDEVYNAGFDWFA